VLNIRGFLKVSGSSLKELVIWLINRQEINTGGKQVSKQIWAHTVAYPI
jgi:hypothetical protein